LSVELRHRSLSSEQSNGTFWPLALEGGCAADHSQKLSSTTSRRLQGSGTQARELRAAFVNNGSEALCGLSGCNGWTRPSLRILVFEVPKYITNPQVIAANNPYIGSDGAVTPVAEVPAFG
jgi:hypothetical protein